MSATDGSNAGVGLTTRFLLDPDTIGERARPSRSISISATTCCRWKLPPGNRHGRVGLLRPYPRPR